MPVGTPKPLGGSQLPYSCQPLLYRHRPPPTFHLFPPRVIQEELPMSPIPHPRTGTVVPVETPQVTTISRRSLEVSTLIIRHDRLITRSIGILGGLVGFSVLLLLVWSSIRPPPDEDLPYTTPHPLSPHAPSTRSLYPHSISVYSPEPEMDESGGQTPGIQVRLFT